MSQNKIHPVQKRRNPKLMVIVGATLLVAGIMTYAGYRISDAMGPMVSSEGNEVGGRFRLMDASDGTMTDVTFRGRWMLVMFGAIHSVDDSSAKMLTQLSQALHVVDPDGRRIAPVFVSLDPQRDLSEQLRQYALQFPAKIISGTGAPATLEAVTKEFHASIEKRPDPEWGYAYMTSPQIVIMNPAGGYAGMMSSSASAQEMQARLQPLLTQH
ncbi:SCO family protein [Acetobacter oeni]|uniref:Electron transporter SenC n=1 Tax=Acetobacter oeni TaxID=304077 RepID=A0A511XL69_9PROT|nr:SCO family protein [Acetobacter oeni]MBB3883937.1 protein SCO1/2 [Acetobacter oeni]NHO19942.1 SCO family protein [Acetobacter oeni]GBR04671.1 electron transport transmembrane protein Sco1/SenC/PrrC [Acetobacter oeni LMG 21952]GEN63678.1 electron transporter SenC [Acetobacter oeni]